MVQVSVWVCLLVTFYLPHVRRVLCTGVCVTCFVLNSRFLSFSSEHGHDMHPSKWIRVCANAQVEDTYICVKLRTSTYQITRQRTHGICHLLGQVLLADPPKKIFCQMMVLWWFTIVEPKRHHLKNTSKWGTLFWRLFHSPWISMQNIELISSKFLREKTPKKS